MLPISKNSANISESAKGGSTVETSVSTSVNEAALTSFGTRSG